MVTHDGIIDRNHVTKKSRICFLSKMDIFNNRRSAIVIDTVILNYPSISCNYLEMQEVMLRCSIFIRNFLNKNEKTNEYVLQDHDFRIPFRRSGVIEARSTCHANSNGKLLPSIPIARSSINRYTE